MDITPTVEPGAAIMTIRSGRTTRRGIARASALFIVVLAGRLDVTIGDDVRRTYQEDQLVRCRPGDTYLLHPPVEDVLLLVVAVPAGPESVLRELVRTPRLDDGALVALAADAGVELLLDPTTPHEGAPE